MTEVFHFGLFRGGPLLAEWRVSVGEDITIGHDPSATIQIADWPEACSLLIAGGERLHLAPGMRINACAVDGSDRVIGTYEELVASGETLPLPIRHRRMNIRLAPKVTLLTKYGTANRFVGDEERLAKCPVLYAASPDIAPGRVASLTSELARDRFAMASVADAAAHAAESKNDYPGGQLWVPHHVDNEKGLVADIIEALGLPQPFTQRYPFVAVESARELMWKGLADRPATLIVIDGWHDALSRELWTSSHANVHIVGTTSIDPDAIVPGAREPALREEPLFAFLSLLAPRHPVPTSLLDTIDPDWRDGLDALREAGLIDVTVLGEPCVRDGWTLPRVDDAKPVVLDAMVRALRATQHVAIHSARRLVPHVHAILVGGFEAVPRFRDFLALASRGYSAVLSILAAERGLALAESEGDRQARADYRAWIANACLRISRPDEAQSAARLALDDVEALHPPDSFEVADAVELLSRAISSGVCGTVVPEALALTRRGVAIREKVLGSTHPDLFSSLHWLGLQLAASGALEEGLEYLSRAEKLAEPNSKSHELAMRDTAEVRALLAAGARSTTS